MSRSLVQATKENPVPRPTNLRPSEFLLNSALIEGSEAVRLVTTSLGVLRGARPVEQ